MANWTSFRPQNLEPGIRFHFLHLKRYLVRIFLCRESILYKWNTYCREEKRRLIEQKQPMKGGLCKGIFCCNMQPPSCKESSLEHQLTCLKYDDLSPTVSYTRVETTVCWDQDELRSVRCNHFFTERRNHKTQTDTMNTDLYCYYPWFFFQLFSWVPAIIKKIP